MDDGFFAGRSAPRVTRPLPMCTRDHDVHALRAWAFQNARDILFYVIMKAGKTSMRPYNVGLWGLAGCVECGVGASLCASRTASRVSVSCAQIACRPLPSVIE